MIMIPRILQKDVRIALLKLEKLPLDQTRKLGKDVGGKNAGGTDDTNCNKCEKILAKIFAAKDTRPVAYATTAKNEEEKLMQKLETIDEQPLIEAEARVQGLDAPPRVIAQTVFRPYDAQQKRQNLEDVAFDEVARKLMSSPPREIDKRLLEAYLYPTYNTTETALENDEVTIDRRGDRDFVAANSRMTEVFPCNEEEIGACHAAVPPFCRVYSVDFIGEASDSTWKAERPQPTHCNAQYATYIEKGTVGPKTLRQLEQIGTRLVMPQELMLVPLPPNETAISSRDAPTSNRRDDVDDRIVPTSISYQTLPRNVRRGSRDDSKDRDQFVAYFSTVPKNQVTPSQLKEDSFENVPLSVLLQRARQRSRIECEMKKDHTWKAPRFFSKGSCLPPLDFQERGKTSSPRPCRPVKKSSTPQKMPCPPPKKNPCPPPKKTICPPPKDPCDPCKPPPKCPPREKPCGLFTGHRIKDTISLILCAYMPLLNKRLQTRASEFPQWPDSAISRLSTCAVCPALLAKNTLLWLQSCGFHFYSEGHLPSEAEECEGIALARSFEPWCPIPSWPMPKKETEKRLVCPKEGCQPPKPSHGPCKVQPCNDSGTRRKFWT